MDFNENENAHLAHSLMMSTLRGVEVVHPSELHGSALERFKVEIAEVWANKVVRTVAMKTGTFPQFVTFPQMVDICLYHLRFIPDRYATGKVHTCTLSSLYRDRHGVLRCRDCESPCDCSECDVEMPARGDES